MIYQVLEEPLSKDELQGASNIPQTLEEFMAEMKDGRTDAMTFAKRLRAMVLCFSFSLSVSLSRRPHYQSNLKFFLGDAS